MIQCKTKVTNKFVIGIAGKKNSGKDTFARMLHYCFTHVNPTFYDYTNRITSMELPHTMSFAEPIKQILSDIFGINKVDFDIREFKDNKYYCPYDNTYVDENEALKDIVLKVEDLNDLTNYIIKGHCTDMGLFENKAYVKLRDLMQWFGTTIGRNLIGENVWIVGTIRKILKHRDKFDTNIYVTDVRFDNENDAIRKLYKGVTIKIVRDKNETNNHVSENIDFECNYTVINNTTLEKLFYSALHIKNTLCKL